MSTLVSSDLPRTIPAQKPPAKASLYLDLVQSLLLKAMGSIGYYSPSAVGIVDALLGNFPHLVLLHLNLAIWLGNGSDGRQSALGDDSDPWAAVVLLGQGSQLLRDLDDVGGSPAMRLGVGDGLSLVTDEVVGVRHDTVELLLEELRDKWSGEGEHKDLYFSIVIRIGLRRGI